jgi:hypothetical protein
MKKKIIAIISLIMAFVCAFALVGCAQQPSSEVSIEEYLAIKDSAFKVNTTKRTDENFVPTTIVYSESYEYSTEEILTIGEGESEVSKKVETEYSKQISKITINFENQNGTLKFTMEEISQYESIERGLTEEGEVEVINSQNEEQKYFYVLEYAENEMRLYRFDDNNPENSAYIIVDKYDVISIVDDTLSSINILNMMTQIYSDASSLYRDGAYVGTKKAEPNSNEISYNGYTTSYASVAYDKNGNMKGEHNTYTYTDSVYSFSAEQVIYEASIKNGATYQKRNIEGINLGDFSI